MRRPVVALVVVLLVVFLAPALVGCGGGAEEPAATPPPAETPPPAPPVADPNAEPITDRSAEESDTFEPFPSSDEIPASVTQRITDKQPMLMLFTDGEAKDSDDTRAEVDAVIKDNKGFIDLLVYDIGKYSTVTKDGKVKVEGDELADDVKAQESVQLARELGVTFAPYVLIVDDQGYIIYRHSGFVDSELLERQVLRVSE